MKLCLAVLSFGCLGAAAHDEERELLLGGDVSLGLGSNELLASTGTSNVGPISYARFGFEFSWILQSDGTAQLQEAVIHKKDPNGGVPTDCPNSLFEHINLFNPQPRGVSYFQLTMQLATVDPPFTSNWNKIHSIYGQKDCSGIALPPGARVGFEYSHVSSEVYNIVSSTGCEDNGDVGYHGAVRIYRPTDDCVSDECTRNLGVSFCEFAWKAPAMPSTTQQCFVSGNAAQKPATASDLEDIFTLVNTDNMRGLSEEEFGEFWVDMGLTPPLGETDLTELFTTFDQNENGRISKSEFGQGAANPGLFSRDNVAAYENLRNCENLGFDTPGCSGYAP